MFSDQTLDHFRNPRNAGTLDPPAVSVEVSNPVCGDTLRLAARFDGNLALEVRFLARGCPASVAAASALTELASGKPRDELVRIDAAAIESALGGLPPASRHAAALAADALSAWLEVWAKETAPTCR
jgi:nitrogen fixation NifU-like protein